MTSDPVSVVILQARMGSTRLPGKSLALIGGETLVAHAAHRLIASAVGPVVLATTAESEDDPLIAEASRLNVRAVRGSRDDVLARFAQAVEGSGATAVIRATADNPAIDIDAAQRALAALESGADYCCERELPYGAVVEAVRTEVLLDASRQVTDDADREHVTTFIRRRRDRYRIAEPLAPVPLRRPDLRLSVDTPEDLEFMRRVAAELRDPLSSAPLAAIIDAADRVPGRRR